MNNFYPIAVVMHYRDLCYAGRQLNGGGRGREYAFVGGNDGRVLDWGWNLGAVIMM